MAGDIRIGVDLGGTKIEIAVLDETGAEVLRRRAPTPSGDYRATLAAIAGLVKGAEAELGRQGTIGIGTPGALSPATGLMKNANSTVLIGKPLAVDLERAIGRAVRIANDADCFALSEAADGAAAGARVVFGVILGTGVGGGLVVDGVLVAGPNAIAGEWGHNPLPWPHPAELPGPRCYCGKFGCVETWLSGPAFARDASLGRAVPFAHARAAITAIAGGDPAARRSLQRYVDRLARGLATVVNLIDPDVIVLGGGMSNVAGLRDAVSVALGDYVFSDAVATQILAAAHGDSSGVRGAARLWPPHDRAAREGSDGFVEESTETGIDDECAAATDGDPALN